MSGDHQTAVLPTPEMTIAEVLSRWPETGHVFQKRRLACVGCAIGPFCTVAEAATAYDVPLDELITDLERAIQKEDSFIDSASPNEI